MILLVSEGNGENLLRRQAPTLSGFHPPRDFFLESDKTNSDAKFLSPVDDKKTSLFGGFFSTKEKDCQM